MQKKCCLFESSCAWAALFFGVVSILPLVAHAVVMNLPLPLGSPFALVLESISVLVLKVGPMNLCFMAAVVPVALLSISGVSIKEQPEINRKL
ncbi:hypothetical protein [Vibrio owensii]|uniref:hypothetical protein n=1 Tax=Vibrio owensii TaxID=696485 RepID=UPI0018F144A0|nr:hypothetical protein [Vibrio owensii]